MGRKKTKYTKKKKNSKVIFSVIYFKKQQQNKDKPLKGKLKELKEKIDVDIIEKEINDQVDSSDNSSYFSGKTVVNYENLSQKMESKQSEEIKEKLTILIETENIKQYHCDEM